MLSRCVLLGLDSAKPIMYLYFACHMFMHTYLHFFIFLYIVAVGTFLILSLSLSLSRALVYSMAPKCKSTPSQNLLGFGVSSSSDPTPSSVRFCDDGAQKDFSKNFCKWGIHSECYVVLSDFSDTDLPTVIHSRCWESFCDIPVTYPSMIIQEFYSNIHGIDTLVPHFFSRIRGTRIVVTSKIVSQVLHVLRVAHLNYPVVSIWGQCPKRNSHLASMRHLLLRVTIKTPLARALQKVWGSLIWWWHLFFILCLTIALLQSFVLDFCCPS